MLKDQIAFTFRPSLILSGGGTLPSGWSGTLGTETRYGTTEAEVLALFERSIGASLHELARAHGAEIRYQQRLDALRAAIEAGEISHSRQDRTWPTIHVYRYAPDSPTGVRLFDSFPDRSEIAALLRGGLSPLSPTEAR